MKLLASALLLAPLASAAAVAREAKVSYDGFKVFRVATHHEPAMVKEKISTLDAVTLNIDENEHLDVAVAPNDIQAFESIGLETEVVAEDMGAEINEEMDFKDYPELNAKSIPGLEWFESYHPYADHVRYFRDVQAAFSSNSEIVNAATSYEGRDIFALHLWGSGGKGSKPAVYFHGTVHAREWISAMTVEYLTYQLVTGYGNDDLVTSILDSYDFYIIPFVNPDGFIYSQTRDRLWRKNRQPRRGSRCVGTDLNRNWPYKWEVPGGASTNKCSQTYKGEDPADTREMEGLLRYTKTLTDGNGIKLYIDWHSYGQYILLPWGYDCTLPAPNQERQNFLARNTAETIRRSSGQRYTWGGSCSTLYATTGDSTDYMTGTAGAELAWTVELRPSSPAGGGFILPPSQILPAADEQWEAMKYLLPAM